MKCLCPECHTELREREGRFPDCEDCGFELYDEYTLALIAEVKREQADCMRVLGFVPTYQDAVRLGMANRNYFDNPLNRQALDRYILEAHSADPDCGPEREDA